MITIITIIAAIITIARFVTAVDKGKLKDVLCDGFVLMTLAIICKTLL